ncbi:MAG: hypothetical protein AMXMBFR56_82520 [Polyangiaceae bacterium]
MHRRSRAQPQTRYEGIFKQGLLDELGGVRVDGITFTVVLGHAGKARRGAPQNFLHR